jgi:hypothetical protein
MPRCTSLDAIGAEHVFASLDEAVAAFHTAEASTGGG